MESKTIIGKEMVLSDITENEKGFVPGKREFAFWFWPY